MEDLRPQKYKESLRKEEQTLKAELSGDKPEQVSSATGEVGDGPSVQRTATPSEKPAPAARFDSPYRDVLNKMMIQQQRKTQPLESEAQGNDAADGPAAETAAVEPHEPKADLASIQDLTTPEGNKIVIPFGNDSNEIPIGVFGTLDRLARVIMDNPEFRLTISGYTDGYGGIKYNKRISEFRANTVKSYLVGKGADPSKIAAKGLGPENPVASNDTLEGRQANRRVELEIDTGNPENF